MYPKIKFKIDSKKDIATLQAFVADAVFDNGRSLDLAIFKKYPQLKKYLSGNKIIDKVSIKKFIEKKYSANSELMKKNLKLFSDNWRKLERTFFELADDLFGDFPWPKGKYIAYFTIWTMYPRFLEDKTFQIPYRSRSRKHINVIIAHEMLHFIFYEYFYRHFKKYKKNKHNYFVWNVSEIFNVIIQNSPVWLKIFSLPTMGYPEHDKITKKLRKKYCLVGKNSVDDLVKDVIVGVDANKNNQE